MRLNVGSKVKFRGEHLPYTVQAADDRFAVCTRPFYNSCCYTVIDFEQNVRGTENLVFPMGAETREQCEDMLDRLNGRRDSNSRALIGTKFEQEPQQTEVSHRNRVPLEIRGIYEPIQKPAKERSRA